MKLEALNASREPTPLDGEGDERRRLGEPPEFSEIERGGAREFGRPLRDEANRADSSGDGACEPAQGGLRFGRGAAREHHANLRASA